MKRLVSIPKWVSGGIKHLASGFPERVSLFAFDTETCHGEPMTLQLYDGEGAVTLLYVNRRTVLREFCRYFDRRAVDGHPNVVVGFNLEYDLPVLFYTQLTAFLYDRFKIDRWGWTFDVFCGSRYFAFAKCEKKRLHVIDAMAFFPGSLDRVSRSLGLPVEKLPKPDGLGERLLTGPAFERYARQDALLTHGIGERILDFHRENDVPLCVTGPQLSSRIFRKSFLHPGDVVSFPSKRCEAACRLSYHGGKNGLYVPAGRYDCAEVDISSAYPYAMSLLPGLLSGSYCYTDRYRPGIPGVYYVKGRLRPCRWPCLMDEEGRILPPGPFKTWATSYEIVSCIENEEIEIDSCSGYVRVDHSVRLPLREYVSRYYALKNRTDKSDPRYQFYKVVLLNSLYGKFAQTIESSPTMDYRTSDPVNVPRRGPVVVDYIETDAGPVRVDDRVFRAGGLYQPFWATLTTGHTRAYLHDLEHLFESLHSATDSVFTSKPVTELPGLGGYKEEIAGPCYLFRNKLYLHYDRKGTLRKYALHGFQGEPEDLLRCFSSGVWEYSFKKMLRPREALIQSRASEALSMVTGTATVRGIKGSGELPESNKQHKEGKETQWQTKM